MAAKTYKEKEERIPFQEDVNVNLFFPGAQRKELVDDVLAALHDEVTFLSISGEEGTGKTMICRIVEKEIADRYMCVYVPENIESFENVIGLFSGQVGLSREISQKEVAAQEEDLILFLREKKQRLVIIFDNAEKMYLAMLERLRKLLDRMNGEETLLQIILSGRRVLYENLEQLEICEFKEIEEIHFHLSALEQAETHAYLNHCAKLRSRELGKCMFSSEAAKKIFSLSKGNLKIANMLATKAIASADAEESFVVHPKNVLVEDSPVFTGKGRIPFFNISTVTSKRKLLVAGAGFVLLGVVLFVFISEDEEQQEKIGSPNQQNHTMSTTTDQDQTADSVKVASSQVEIQGTSSDQGGTVDQENESLFVVKETGIDTKDKLIDKETEAAVNSVVRDEAGNNVIDGLKSNEASGTVEEVGGLATVNTDENQSEDQNDSQPSQSKTSDTKESTGQVVVSQLTVKDHMDKTSADDVKVLEEIKPRQQKTVDRENGQQDNELMEDSGDAVENVDSPVLSDSSKTAPLRLAIIAEPKQIPRIAPVRFSSSIAKESLQTQENSAAATPADILYQQRVLAGRQMLLQEQGDSRTIQLMALTAGKAEENLQNRFTREEYRTIAENLYIVKSKDNSKVFVYYGKFADEDAAQQARNTLPPFLRKNSPYVISLEEARRKTNLNQ